MPANQHPTCPPPVGGEADPLRQLNQQLAALLLMTADLGRRIQRFCVNVEPILALLDEALLHVDSTTETTLPALLQAIGHGRRQDSLDCQAVYGLTIQQLEMVDQVLLNESVEFASLGRVLVDMLAQLLAVLHAHATLDRSAGNSKRVPMIDEVWLLAQDAAEHSNSLCMRLREHDGDRSSAILRNEMQQLYSLLTQFRELADRLVQVTG